MGSIDDLPKQSFYMVGGIEEIITKAEKIARESICLLSKIFIYLQ